jgi:bacterioferritin
MCKDRIRGMLGQEGGACPLAALRNLGWVKLAKHTRAESLDEMRHAELLTDRILFLDALPNYQRLFALRIGQTIGQLGEQLYLAQLVEQPDD